MIRYKKYQVTGEDSPLKGLWYARPVIEETFDIEKLAKHMSPPIRVVSSREYWQTWFPAPRN